MLSHRAKYGWLLALCLLAQALAMPSPTQDTLIVTRADDSSATESSASTTATPEEVTTEAALAPLKMSSMDVRSEIALRYAHTTVVTKMRNPAAKAQEATFSILLPETAFISGFTMVLDGKPYKAYVKEKEEAKAVYSDAVAHGLGAAHISAKARDSNHFTVSVNIEPTTEALFNLTYEELLDRRNGVYNHAINLNPGRVVPHLNVVVHIKEGKKITVLRVPEMRTGNEIDATEEEAQNPNAIIGKGNNDKEATISFSPDIVEQTRLMKVYAQKAQESRSRPRYSYERYYPVEEQEASKDGILGQFVVQYDVERSTDGEVFINDGYFVHFFAPPNLQPLNKHIIFVLDTSGSMMDHKIIQLREAMTSILSELNEGDYFNIIEFASDAHVYDLKEGLGEPRRKSYFYFGSRPEPKVTLVPPAPANKKNIELAKIIVSRLEANGGTNIASALDVALSLANKGIDWTPEVKPAESGASTAVPATEITTIADPKSEVQKPEPVIIFLTDGDPTVGEMNPKRIIKRITELNSGYKKAAIFSLAFGEDADRGFLRKLSLRNEGFLRHIYEAADAAAQLKHFYRQVSSPLLANVRFVYPPEQVVEGSITKHRFHTLYKGSEVVVAGRVSDLTGVEYFSPQVIGICGVTDDMSKRDFTSIPRIPVQRDLDDFGPLERLWAYMTIKQKLDEKDSAIEDNSSDNENDKQSTAEKEALSLALKYSFVTPLTSLVVVKPNASSAVDAESVDKIASASAAGGGSAFYNLAAVGVSGLPAPAYASFSAGSPPLQVPSASDVMAFDMEELSEADDVPLNLDRVSIKNVIEESSTIVVSSTTTIPSTTVPHSTTTRNLEAELKKYHLEGFLWMSNHINLEMDTVQLSINATIVTLKLAKEMPIFSTPESECLSAVDNQPGKCTYLTACPAAKNISFDLYEKAYCDREGYAGICCASTAVPVSDGVKA